MSIVLVNTNLAAVAGALAAISVSKPLLGRYDPFVGLNGAIAGLVSITAGPDIVEHHWAIIIGAAGRVLCTAGIKLLGIVAIGAFVFGTSWVLWLVIDKTIKARVSRVVEVLGKDVVELGIEAYPEFQVIPDPDDIDELNVGE